MAALPDIEIYLTSGGDEEVQTLVNRVSIRQRGKTIQCHGEKICFVFFRVGWCDFVDRMAANPKHTIHEITRNLTN
jgi:hypothetical protein